MDPARDPDEPVAVDPAPQTATVIIDRVSADTRTQETPAPRRLWKRRPCQAAAALGVVAAAGAGAFAIYTMRSNDSPTIANTPPSLSEALAKVTPTPALTISNSGSLPVDHHTFRVVSAPTDLSGQHELAWLADSGHRVGDAQCTQNFRIGQNASAYIRPTMLICWRTSPTKSVYTVAVNLDQTPSEEDSVAKIEEIWATMG